MRHRKARSKLGRSPSHIKAMRSNMLVSLIQHRRIKTTERKARDLRSNAEKAVTRFTALGDLLLKDRTKLEPVRPGSDVSLPVQVVDQFLERMLANPEKFAGDIKRLSKKFGGVLFSSAEVRTLRHKVGELSELVSSL